MRVSNTVFGVLLMSLVTSLRVLLVLMFASFLRVLLELVACK